MGLIQINIGPILLFDGNNLWQPNNGPFHGVNPFHNDENLFPWPSGSGMAFNNGLAEDAFQTLNIAVKGQTNA